MELRQLRAFVAVAEAGSMTRAAAGLHMAQQSLSEQMRTLEAQLGVTLLHRSPRGVTPTPVGEVLLREARDVLARAERAQEAVVRAAGGEEGHLRVAFLASVANDLMPPVVRGFRERHPGIALETEESSIADLVAGLRAGRLDAALTRPPLVADLHAEELLREPVAAVLPAAHALAGARELRLADLAGEPWVLTPREAWPPWHRVYDEDFARAGFRPRVVQRAATVQGLLALVAAGVGVTRLAFSARSLRPGDVVFVPLAGDTAATVLLTRPGASNPALPRLRALVRELV